MRSIKVGVIAAGAVLTLTATAAAGSSYSKPQKVAPTGCYDSQTSLDAKGDRLGFVICRAKSGRTNLESVRGTSGASKWALKKVGSQATLIATAGDGRSDYALYTAKRHTYLAELKPSGALRRHELSKDEPTLGALVAHNGKWFAVFSQENSIGDGTCPTMFAAGTLVGLNKPTSTKACGQPALGLDHHGRPILVTVGLDNAGNNVTLRTWEGSNWSKGETIGSNGRAPFIATHGKTTYVAYVEFLARSQQSRTVLATQHGSSHWKHKTFPHVAGFDTTVTTGPQVAASSRALFVAWTAVIHHHEQVQVEQHKHSWSGQTVGDGTSGDAVMDDLDAIHGHAYLTIDHSDNTLFTVVRHQ